jgi:uncharacterized membrane protein
MHALSVWRFDTPEAAARLLPRLERLAAAGEVSVEDAALVAWPRGPRKPATSDLGSLIGPGALWGGFWGMVLGLIFLTQLAGPTFGAAAGAVAGGLCDFGVPDDFVMRVRQDVVPGTSALFVVSTQAAAERLTVELEGVATRTSHSVLSHAAEQHLHGVLSDESARGS